MCRAGKNCCQKYKFLARLYKTTLCLLVSAIIKKLLEDGDESGKSRVVHEVLHLGPVGQDWNPYSGTC